MEKKERNKEQYKKTETETKGNGSRLPCDFFTAMYNTDVEKGLTFRFIAGGNHSKNSDCKNPIRVNWQGDVIRWRC